MDRNTWTRSWTSRDTFSSPNIPISQGQLESRLRNQALGRNRVLRKTILMTTRAKSWERKDKMLKGWRLVQTKTWG